jgi:hypothetical protein
MECPLLDLLRNMYAIKRVELGSFLVDGDFEPLRQISSKLLSDFWSSGVISK